MNVFEKIKKIFNNFCENGDRFFLMIIISSIIVSIKSIIFYILDRNIESAFGWMFALIISIGFLFYQKENNRVVEYLKYIIKQEREHSDKLFKENVKLYSKLSEKKD
jgi:hypothetical protein